MSDHRTFGLELQRLLATRLPAIGISFAPAAPAGVPRVSSPLAAACSYWRAAAEGAVFHATAADLSGCPIGMHTHGVPMQPQSAAELQGVVQTMVGLGYVSMEEVAKLPHREAGPGVVVYGPVAALPVAPQLVLVRGTARQLMLLAEAAQAAGVQAEVPAMGRPTCAALPLALDSAKATTSLGCIGNRVYTGLDDGEGYVAIPAAALPALVAKLAVISHANAELEKFHRARAARA